MPMERHEAMAWAANASLISKRSMSSGLRPASFRAFGIATAGPMPISSGAQPATAKTVILARGLSPRALAFSAVMSRAKAAPSVICEELPAVTDPPALKAGLSLPRSATVVGQRTPSSVSKTTASRMRFPLASFLYFQAWMGTISSLNLPVLIASVALRLLSTPILSWSSRETLYLAATFSAVMPMDTYVLGRLPQSGSGRNWLPPMGMWDMVSQPPAMITSDQPAWILAVASAMDWIPEEQNRLIVIPEASIGRPAPRV